MGENRAKKTMDYGLFVRTVENRVLDLKKHTKLLKSMKKRGFLWYEPILVKRQGAKLEIIDGQHRHAVAQELGLPVWYLELDAKEQVDVASLNETTVAWTTHTYIEHWSQKGIGDYAKALALHERYKIPSSTCAALLAGTASSANVHHEIRQGTFRVKDEEHAERVASVVARISAIYRKARDHAFIEAICSICRINDKAFDLSRLVESIEKRPHLIQPFGTRDSILENLEYIYNFQKHGGLYPLKVSAMNAMRQRRATNGFKGSYGRDNKKTTGGKR